MLFMLSFLHMEHTTQPSGETQRPHEENSEQQLLDRLAVLRPYFSSENSLLRLDELNDEYHTLYNDQYVRSYNALSTKNSTPEEKRPVAKRKAQKLAMEYLCATAQDIIADLHISNVDEEDEIQGALLEVGSMDVNVWQADSDADGNVIQGVRDIFGELPVGEVAENPDVPDDTPEAINPAVEQARLEVVAARELWAKASAKRQGKLFSIESESRDALKQDYNDKVIALGKLKVADLLADPDAADDAKNLAVITHLFEEQKELRRLTIEKLQGTSVSAIIKWMNKGRFATRIAKGVGIGIVAGLAGGFVAGAVGAAVVGTGLVATTRFARGFASRDNKKRGMQTAQDAVDQEALKQSVEAGNVAGTDRFDSALQNLDALFEADTKKEQSKRRNAAVWGIGSMAVGATIGLGVHFGIEQMANHDIRVTSLFNHGDTNTGSGHQAVPGEHPSNPPNNGVHDNGNGAGPNHIPAPAPPEVAPPVEFSEAAQTINTGEGWYQTFKDMGITNPTEQANLLQRVGPELQARGWAYPMSGHSWGISRPGQLPTDVLELIKNSR